MRALAALLVLWCGVAQAQTPDLIKRAAVKYPIRAMDRSIEGWAELSFTVKADGTTAEIAVTDSYPDDVFAKAAKESVAAYVYTPIPHDVPNQRTRLLFALLDRGAVRSGIAAKLDEAMTAARGKRLEDADKILQEFEADDELTLAEYAFFERVRGTRHWTGGDYAGAARSFDRAVDMLGAGLGENAAKDLQKLLVMARVNAGQLNEALADFDRFALAGSVQGKDLTDTMATIRAAQAAGRTISVSP
jgi:TonB family protein